MKTKAFIFMSLLSFASTTFCDGVYFPEIAVKKIPVIPAQRAILSCKDGIETLVISSALDSESQKLGWIIPIPNVPLKIEKTTPGIFNTLEFCTSPKITHDLYVDSKIIIIAFVTANILIGTRLFKREYFFRLLIIFVFLFVLWSLTLSAESFSMSEAVKSLQVETSVNVGSYDIKILRAKKQDELNKWLAENDFNALPKEADAIIAEYISKNWVFAAIKLSRAESGANVPHPILMSFKSETAIYPMKLTAVSDSNTNLEIFVIADNKASSNLLNVQFCNSYKQIPPKPHENDINYEKDQNVAIQTDFENSIFYEGIDIKKDVGHSAICPLMWDGCVLTKLAGTLNKNSMTSDLLFNWVSFKSYIQHFYTITGALYSLLIFFACSIGICNLFFMFKRKKMIAQPCGLRKYIFQVLLPIILITACCAGILFSFLPKIKTSEYFTARRYRSNLYIIKASNKMKIIKI